jgi:glycosyltransferase involved in cell wall biosynthesis
MAIPITIFTPTFNRAELLPRAYQSLCEQTFQAFEWLIVDDGSTDDTADRVRAWQRSAPFSVCYVHQPNGGKHRAHNAAVRRAQGELFAVLDSDDVLVPTAIERLLFHWNSIPEPERSRFSGVTGLCTNPAGKLVGRPFPSPVLDCRHYEAAAVFGATGEKWGCHRTAILRQFPFPEIAGEKFCPEALVWNRIARRYLVRHISEPLRIYHGGGAGLTSNWVEIMTGSAQGARQYYGECLELSAPAWWRARGAVNYVRFSLHAGVSLWRAVQESARPIFTALVLPLGCVLHVRDLLRRRSSMEPSGMPRAVPDSGGGS